MLSLSLSLSVSYGNNLTNRCLELDGVLFTSVETQTLFQLNSIEVVYTEEEENDGGTTEPGLCN